MNNTDENTRTPEQPEGARTIEAVREALGLPRGTETGPLTREYAEALDGKIRAATKRPDSDWDLPNLSDFGNLLEEAEDLSIYSELGYPSWKIYCDDALGGYKPPAITVHYEDIVPEYLARFDNPNYGKR